ncbi:MAG: DUF58 domain-containing protein [Planctomycetes bacterium]|nr:DUF58 domain-containing protein [Planctomycetota bacterium]
MNYSPTIVCLLTAAILCALAALALGFPFLLPLWGIATGVFFLLIFIDLVLLPRKNDLTLERKAPGEQGVGIDFPLEVRIGNAGSRALRMKFWDILPVAMDGPRDALAATLTPGKISCYTRQYRLLDRGKIELGPATLEAFGPLRMLRRIVRLEAKATIMGIPGVELLQSNRLILRAMQDADSGINRSRGVGRGGEFESLAPYVPGDPVQSVDWKGFARSGNLTVRRYEPERRRHVMLCCDAGRLMGGRVGGRRKVDLALASLARVAAAALQRGDLVGLCIFDATVRVLIPPRAGGGQLARIIRASLEVSPSHGETAFTPAFVAMGHALTRRALVVLATDFDNEAQGWELHRNVAAVHKRHAVIVCSMRDPVYQQTLGDEVLDLHGAYRQLASLTLLDERRDILFKLQKVGVHTIDAEPDELSGPLLNMYGRVVSSGAL